MNITVTHTIHPDVMAILQSAFAVANNVSQRPAAKTNGKALVDKTPLVAPPVEVEDTPLASSTTVVEPSAITIEQVRAAVQVKSQAGKRDEIKKLLSEFGADKVTNLQKDQYADFHAKIEKL